MSLLYLPADVILLIFPYLTAYDFLSFTGCTKRFLSFRQEPTFWRTLTISTFRIPPQPLLRSDGARWQWLYKSLLTQTSVYTWGNNERGNLGHGFGLPPAMHHHALPRNHGWPTEIEEIDDVGVVADVQCGGWSTVLLNSTGQLFFCGVVDGEKLQVKCPKPALLGFPPGFPPTTRKRYEPDTAIKQYSVGRSRILAISDSGKMWEWADGGKPAMLVKLLSVDVAEGTKFGKGRVTRVVSGWAGSSAYIDGTGIVFWNRMPDQEEASLMDAYCMESFTVPGTSFKRSRAGQHSNSSVEFRIGEVLNHVVLENSIVFVTHLNKVFAYPFSFDPQPGSAPVELTTFQQPSPSFHIEDVQGSFRNFGIFSSDGAVLLGTTTLINSFINASYQCLNCTRNPVTTTQLPEPFLPPALQCTSVVSLAFGDYHYHALHADGTITSHGTEPQRCGALGLGPWNLGPLRGLRYDPHEGTIVPPSTQSVSLPSTRPDSTSSLRTIWFEPEKWNFLCSLYKTSAAERFWNDFKMNNAPLEFTQTYGDWFEREGREWHLGPPDQRARTEILPSETTSPGTARDSASEEHPDKGAYFAVKISAAGWHSAALVLVDPEKAERVRKNYVVSPPASTAIPSTNVDGKNASYSASLPASSEITVSPSSSLSLRGLGTSLNQAGHRFLGLTTRDEMQAESGEGGKPAERGADDARAAVELQYIWEGSPLPMLLCGHDGKNGILPGTGQVTGWKSRVWLREAEIGRAGTWGQTVDLRSGGYEIEELDASGIIWLKGLEG